VDILIQRAIVFATQAHAGQTRKYTGEPYVNHPVEVMQLVSEVNDDPEVLAAAVLHDVVEDTPATITNIRIGFNARVAALVDDLTDVSKPEDGNRATRKELDRQHTAKASPDAKTVKLADLISNSMSIIKDDPNFAKVYMKEKRALLEVLTEGDATLYKRASQMVDSYFANRS
jgi:(p)ppGpp synthase/HD superfamily hydrolase